GVSHPHFADERFEALAVRRGRARLTKVGVDDHDLLGPPTERDGSLPQGILTRSALAVLDDLSHRRLSDVEECLSLEMLRGDLLLRFVGHASCSLVSIVPIAITANRRATSEWRGSERTPAVAPQVARRGWASSSRAVASRDSACAA